MQAQEILERVSVLLQDDNTVRWTAPELRNYLNDGQREIALLKPSEVSQTVEIALVAGTRQALAPDQFMVLDFFRNQNGKAVRTVNRRVLDTQMPGWQDSSILPYSADVVHVIYETEAPREFFVAPGNTGAGSLEIRVAVLPADIPEPASPLMISSYTAPVGVPDIYRSALTDYVLYRAYSKDSESPTASQLARFHYAQFAQAVGAKAQTEIANDPSSE